MKKLIFFLLLMPYVFTPLLPARTQADAAAEYYAVAATNGVWFYEKADEASGLFMIPRTYYVRVLSEGDTFCKVQYGDGEAMPMLEGYCKRESVTPVNFIPARPYLLKEITLTYTLAGSQGDFDDFEKPFLYYGSTFRGTARYLYVYADDKFGLVYGESEPEYPLNDDYLSTDNGEVTPPDRGGILTSVQIVLVCIVVGAVLVCAVLLCFTKKPTPVRLEEEEEP